MPSRTTLEDQTILRSVLPECELLGEEDLQTLLADDQSNINPVPMEGGADFSIKEVYELARAMLTAIRQLRNLITSSRTEVTVKMGTTKVSIITKNEKILKEVQKQIPTIIDLLKQNSKKSPT
jgi:hypothetical protein